MNFPLRLLSNVSVSVIRRIPAAAGGKVSRSSAVQSVARSFASTQPEKALCYEDFVKETLKKMVSERGTENLTREIADLDLERRFQHYDRLLQEAESCIVDLKEATLDQRDEEFVCASGALDTAFEAYVDLLDDLRMANEEQLKAYQEARDKNARKFMSLRRELAEIMSDSV